VARLLGSALFRRLFAFKHRAEHYGGWDAGPKRVFQLAGARLGRLGRQYAGIGGTVQRLANPHFREIVSKLLPAVEANDIGSTVWNTPSADRSHRTRKPAVWAAEQQVQHGIDHGSLPKELDPL